MSRVFRLYLVVLTCLLFVATETQAAKPFRVLVVIGDQWKDPASFMVQRAAPTGEYSGYFKYPEVYGENDFHQLMILLKSWGIPFDVVRLDQQFLQASMFTDMYGDPMYGTIIWDVNQGERLLDPDYSIVRRMVLEQGIGIIALADRISQPEIQDILGLKYVGAWESNKELSPVSRHFLTEGLASSFQADVREGVDEFYGVHLKRQKVELEEGAEVLVTQGDWPQVTARSFPSGGRAVWIGNDPNGLFEYQDLRTLLRRAITWTIGYNLYKTWENDLIMIMDDPGGAQNTYLEHWQYPTLTEEQITRHLIEPLQKHQAVLNINFVPGFVNDENESIEAAWTQDFTDHFGAKQDFKSGKRGYDKGIKLGVFEVMCHGLTHMQPDLHSEPGWYGAPYDQEKAEVGWYREFGDTRRNQEIPAAEQLWRMKTAKKWLTEQFGVVPLEFCAGGNGASTSYHNNTFKLAAQAGFGWCGWTEGYCGTDMVIIDWDFMGTSDSPDIVAAPPDAHDFGIVTDPGKFVTIFDQYPHGRFISINEYIAYLHARNSGSWDKEGKKLRLRVDYDPHYCRYFGQKTSVWNLELADWLVEEMGEPAGVLVNGKSMKYNRSAGALSLPAGAGEHEIEVKFEKR